MLKDFLDSFLINVSLLNSVELLTYNSDHSVIISFPVNFC